MWHHRRDDLKDLRCMTFTSKGASEILVAGCQNVMLKIDVDKGEVLQTVRCSWSLMQGVDQIVNISLRYLPRTTTHS